jgi:hypothetical protein
MAEGDPGTWAAAALLERGPTGTGGGEWHGSKGDGVDEGSGSHTAGRQGLLFVGAKQEVVQYYPVPGGATWARPT